MKFPSFSSVNPVKKESARPAMSVAQELRKKAIEDLQTSLRKEESTLTDEVRKNRLKALITLLEEQDESEFGELDKNNTLH